MRISDWSSDVCSSDLLLQHHIGPRHAGELEEIVNQHAHALRTPAHPVQIVAPLGIEIFGAVFQQRLTKAVDGAQRRAQVGGDGVAEGLQRSEEHTHELQSLMRISYAVFSVKKK